MVSKGTNPTERKVREEWVKEGNERGIRCVFRCVLVWSVC